jgi:hypothetical protein
MLADYAVQAIFALGLFGVRGCLVLMVLSANRLSMYDLKQRIAAASDGCHRRLARGASQEGR